MLKHKKTHVITLLICLLLMLNAAPVFASGGDGSGKGDGSGLGENKDIELTLVCSSVPDQAADVALNETIQLDFNKNICNITVLSNNKTCFHLTDADGNAVPIKLIFPDTQLQQDYKHEVFIIPKEDLKSNSKYRISVDSTLTANNGTLIDNAHTVTFTTGTERTDRENKILKKLGDYTVTYETSYSENENSVPVNKDGLDDVSEDNGADTGSIAKIAALALIIIIIIFTAVFIIFKRRK